eukprot:GHRR01011221.1.p1 GENE.GHRR01011221.1~~GHRR01011221.1.p1  ORF type:complete len:120 (+),score=38.86 GHRR01011221.1:148-507(+)
MCKWALQVREVLMHFIDVSCWFGLQAALKAYNADGNGTLNQEECQQFAKSLLKSGPDTFFARVGKDALIKTALLPALTIGIKSAGSQMPGLQSVKDVSLAVLAPAVGVVFKAVRALAPY